ncbi:Peptidase S33 tripeptidyl aminopeptidase-like C-terminal [Penicillium hispanicum]|uniref:Peptidase S33 tripeptidyl aminopeptidase-like C-terminal n=1 Tax=Penicillium hispanicum TaxID=1080232 RepID=UPI00254224A1|nr:Peptidase S33 tripeptidyl aminopeptidase-like C-terminal [Penicillium hispanicum]KAJ5591469.1 Peptidase S33 tripeptidyl aminopeptidase-like C-terminal [Penicillium hispanicum]
MEDWKSADPQPRPCHQTSARRRFAARCGIAALAGAFVCLRWTGWLAPTRTPVVPASVSTAPFTWDQISPSELLEYHDCGDGFQCARLEVPMDYNQTDGQGRKFALAIVRIPAPVPVGDPRYGGAVLINPGGPGGPGTLQAFVSGRNLQKIINAESDPNINPVDSGDKYFDIIGFDPRGVGSTTPAVTCFPDPISQRTWELQVEAEGMLGSCPDALQRNWQRTQALNQGCSVYEMTAAQGEEPMMSYLNTPLVARDMITIIERHGEWRQKEGQKQQAAHDRCHGVDESAAIAQRTRWQQGEEPLYYWGRSYGTLLGMTFAALFPERIARAVLDGVVNMDMYYEGRGPNAVMDADAIFDRFGHYCDAVGFDGCPFYVDGGPEAIKEAYWAIEEQILNASIPVMASFTRGPEVVTWTDLKAILRVAVYQPLIAFPVLAQVMSELAMGNYVPMADFKHRRHFGACPDTECSIAGPWSPACAREQDNSLYASAAILCTDAEHLSNHTMESFQSVWDGLKSDSAALGDYWAQLELACVGWKAKPKYKFEGPWGSVTSHPMLFVSNTLDPVTPLHSAQHMSQKFPGSVLLQQDSEGHTSIAAPSLCISKAIRSYFQTGALPKAETLCDADLKPLVGAPSKHAELIQDMDPADRELFEVLMEEVQRGFLA